MVQTDKQIIGQIGENAVSDYLRSKGFSILERNYNKKWGELDIVAKKVNKLYFVEVKSISREIADFDEKGQKIEVSREKSGNHINSGYRAEDNMHPWKVKRLSRVIQTYLLDKKVPEEIAWQVDLATVDVDTIKKLCRIKILSDIIL